MFYLLPKSLVIYRFFVCFFVKSNIVKLLTLLSTIVPGLEIPFFLIEFFFIFEHFHTYTWYVLIIATPKLPPAPQQVLLPPLWLGFIFNNSLSLVSPAYMSQQLVISLKKNGSLFPSSLQLPIAPQPGVDHYEPLLHLCWSYWLPDLVQVTVSAVRS